MEEARWEERVGTLVGGDGNVKSWLKVEGKEGGRG